MGGASEDTQPGALRILHILRAPLGGLFRHVCDLVEEQARMGHQAGIVCDSGTGGAVANDRLKQLQSSCALGIVRMRMGRTLGPGDIATMAKIARHAARLTPDVIHGHGAKGGAYARLLPPMAGRTVLYTPHGGSLHYSWKNPAGALFLALERLLMPRTGGILFESQFSQSAYEHKIGHPSCPARVVPNGLCEADFAPLPAAKLEYDAVFVGELRMLKGVATLIEAASRIAPLRPFRLGIAGSGPDEGRFRALAAAHGIADRVDFLGHRPAREVFARARTIVIPSLAESFPYIVLEALASGRNVIATNAGGIPEMFGPEAGKLLTPGDVVALETAIRETLDAPEALERRRLALRERAKAMYSTPRMARDIVRFYAELGARSNAVAREAAGTVKLQETMSV
jgi:glycosyltransferase involved in cell wall biosynthesis